MTKDLLKLGDLGSCNSIYKKAPFTVLSAFTNRNIYQQGGIERLSVFSPMEITPIKWICGQLGVCFMK